MHTHFYAPNNGLNTVRTACNESIRSELRIQSNFYRVNPRIGTVDPRTALVVNCRRHVHTNAIETSTLSTSGDILSENGVFHEDDDQLEATNANGLNEEINEEDVSNQQDFKLHRHQQDCVDASVEGYLAGKKRQLAVLPVGSGKTVIFSHLAKRISTLDQRIADEVPNGHKSNTPKSEIEQEVPVMDGQAQSQGGKILVLAHRHELLSQAKETLLKVDPNFLIGIDCGFSKPDTEKCDIICASVSTLGKAGADNGQAVDIAQLERDEESDLKDDNYTPSYENFEKPEIDYGFLTNKRKRSTAKSTSPEGSPDEVITEDIDNPCARLLRYNPKDFKMVIVDECHHITASTYRRILLYFIKNNPDIYVWGCTATPFRTDKIHIKEILNHRVYTMLLQDAISDGFLSSVKVKQIPTSVDIADISSSAEDYSNSYLDKKLVQDGEERNRIICEAMQRAKIENNRKKFILFAVNVEHVYSFLELLPKYGITCEAILGETSTDARAGILDRFKRGEIECLINCGVLTEGFNEPSIDCVVLARPTASMALLIQMVGRGLRTFEGKEDCLIIDILDEGTTMSNPAVQIIPEIKQKSKFQSNDSEQEMSGSQRKSIPMMKFMNLDKDVDVDVDNTSKTPDGEEKESSPEIRRLKSKVDVCTIFGFRPRDEDSKSESSGKEDGGDDDEESLTKLNKDIRQGDKNESSLSPAIKKLLNSLNEDMLSIIPERMALTLASGSYNTYLKWMKIGDHFTYLNLPDGRNCYIIRRSDDEVPGNSDQIHLASAIQPYSNQENGKVVGDYYLYIVKTRQNNFSNFKSGFNKFKKLNINFTSKSRFQEPPKTKFAPEYLDMNKAKLVHRLRGAPWSEAMRTMEQSIGPIARREFAMVSTASHVKRPSEAQVKMLYDVVRSPRMQSFVAGTDRHDRDGVTSISLPEVAQTLLFVRERVQNMEETLSLFDSKEQLVETLTAAQRTRKSTSSTVVTRETLTALLDLVLTVQWIERILDVHSRSFR